MASGKDTCSRSRDDVRRDYLALLYDQYAVAMHKRAYRVLSDYDSAWDVVQDVFVRLARGLNDRRSLTYNYLARATYNEAISYKRSLRARHDALIRYASGEPHSQPDGYRAHVPWSDILSQIDRLPPRCKRILEMKLTGKKNAEIARVLGITTKTVEYHYSYGCKLLRARMSSACRLRDEGLGFGLIGECSVE